METREDRNSEDPSLEYMRLANSCTRQHFDLGLEAHPEEHREEDLLGRSLADLEEGLAGEDHQDRIVDPEEER